MYWLPSNEADILSAIDSGLLGEGQHLDVKLTYQSRKPSVNAEIAQDLAAFAVDGGAILVGIRQSGESLVAEPQPLADVEALAERVSQVARDRPSPPILALTRVIRSEAHIGAAYLLIEVPPSPSAPHSVDGVYWGRGDRANRRLVEDREVDRLIRARTNTARLAADRLDTELLAGSEASNTAVLYVAAEPAQAHDDEALLRIRPSEIARSPFGGVDGGVWEVVHQSAPFPAVLPDDAAGFISRVDGFPGSDRLDGARGVERRARGRVVRFHGLGVRANEIEILEHGGVRLVREGLSRPHTIRAQYTEDDDLKLCLIDDYHVVASVWRVLAVAAELSERIGYRGSWSFALHITGLGGTVGAAGAQYINDRLDMSQVSTYDQPTYRRSAVTTTVELQSEPVRVLYRLVGRLLRGLDVDHEYRRWINGWPGEEGC